VAGDIFISYAREDRDRIERLAAAIEAEGIGVWWDRDIAGGAEFTKETEARLDAAKAVLVAWSAASVESTWVCDEATVGRERGNLVPVVIDAVAPRLGFRSFQTIDLAGWRGDRSAPEFADLVRVLKARVSGEAPPPVLRRAPTIAARWRRHRLPIMTAAALVVMTVAALLIAPRLTTTPAPAASTADESLPPAATPEEGVGLGVLPFTNLSADPEQEHFADGLTEEILNWLGNVEGLKVPGRTSSFQFKGKAADLRAIGRALGVQYVLEGSVRRSGDSLRITAQLIDASTGYHRWSQAYDRKMADIFAIQDEIARVVVTELLGKIPETGVANPAAVGEIDPRAHELYLAGRALYSRRDVLKAYEKFRAATAVDARHAFAQTYLAVIAANVKANGGSIPGEPDLDAAATRALAEAVRLRPEAADVVFAQGWVAEHRSGAVPGSQITDQAIVALYERAVKANPRHVEALHALTRAAKSEEAKIQLYERVLDIDPAHWAARNNLIRLYTERGDRTQAISVARQSLTAAPGASRFSAALAGRQLGEKNLTGDALFADWDAVERGLFERFIRASVLAELGAFDEARFLFAREIDKAAEEAGWPQMARIDIAVLDGNNESGLAAAEEMHRLAEPPPWASWTLATALIRSGDPQRAYDVIIARRPDLASGKPEAIVLSVGNDLPDSELLVAAHALHLLGRQEEARALWSALLDAVKAAGQQSWAAHLSLSLLSANLGDRSAAIKEFKAAHEAGFRHLRSYESFDCVLDGFYAENGLFAELVKIPEVAGIVKKIESENAETLEEFNRKYGILDRVRSMMATADAVRKSNGDPANPPP
jgi:TolB-like protein